MGRWFFDQETYNFDVKEGPFIVRSGTMSVTALGTEFNVAAYPEENEMIAGDTAKVSSAGIL